MIGVGWSNDGKSRWNCQSARHKGGLSATCKKHWTRYNWIIKNLAFNNEDTIIELIALKNSYSDKVETIKELDHGILNLLKQDEREKELEINLMWEDNVHRLFAKVERCFGKLKTPL